MNHNLAPFSGSVSEIISALTGGDGTSWGYSTLRYESGILQCDRFRDEILRLVSLLEANSSSVYGDSSVTLDDLSTLINWTVTSDPSDPLTENIAILGALDSSYASAPVEAGPITIEQATQGPITLDQMLELQRSVDNIPEDASITVQDSADKILAFFVKRRGRATLGRRRRCAHLRWRGTDQLLGPRHVAGD